MVHQNITYRSSHCVPSGRRDAALRPFSSVLESKLMMRIFATLFAAALVAACATPINRHTAENYYRAGEDALAKRDLPRAKEMFNRALINVSPR